MGYVNWQLGVLKFNPRRFEWDDTPVYLDTFHDVEVTESIGEDKDVFSFKMPITAGLDDDTIQMNDRIIIKRSLNGEPFANIDPLMIGRVRDVGPTVTHSEKVFDIEGYNYSEAVAGLLIFVNAIDKTPPEAMKRALDRARDEIETFNVTWAESNPMVKTDGTPFPIVGERVYYRPLKYLMRKYSTSEYTEDVPYYWYINEKDELVWEPMTNAVNDSFDAREDTFVEFDQGLDTDGRVNAVLVKAGELPTGRQITIYKESSLANSRNGRQYKILPSIAENASVLNDQDMKELGYRDRQFPRASDYEGGFQVTWFSKATNSFPVVFSNDEYVRALEENVRFIANKEANQILEDRQFARVEAEIKVRAGAQGWALGDQVRVFAPRIGEFKDLRVMSIKRKQEMDEYYLREDRGSF